MYNPADWVFATVDAIIVKDGKILIEKRSPGFWGGYWCVPGGHVDKDNKILDEVAREVREETGLSVRVGSVLGIYSGRRYKKARDVSIVFLCKAAGGRLKLQKGEIDELAWFPLNRLPKRIAFDHRRIIRDAVAVMKGKKKAPIIS